MTLPPYERPSPYEPGAPEPHWVPVEEPVAPRRSRRRVVIGAAITGAAVLGGAGYAVAAYLGGGGPQPEDVLPDTTLAFAKVDLDPSAGQKMALMSLLEQFPDVATEGSDDIRGQLLEPMLEVSEHHLDYASDVQPWLGDRMAVAMVAAEDIEGGGVPVVALAVDDVSLMTDTLTRVQQTADLGFAIRDDYVLITDTQERADEFAAAERTLADDADFAGDREALGGEQVALAWADLSSFEAILAEQAAAEGLPADFYGDQGLSGRVIVGLHAQDDALEVVGLDFRTSDAGVPAGEPTRLMRGLPADTLGAVSASGVGEYAVDYWEELQQFVGAPGMDPYAGDPYAGDPDAGSRDPFAELGLELPGDLRTLLGSDLVVAAFGDAGAPSFAARVVTDDGPRASQLIENVLASPEFGYPVVVGPAPEGYAVGSDPAAVEAVAGTDGGLVGTDAFQAAVADPEAATVLAYVDLATVVDQMVAQGGDAGAEAARFSAVRALGLSVTSTDEGNRFVVRITTR